MIVVSFPLRKRIGMRAWRRLHWATYGLFALATVHGLAAGTDTPTPWAFAHLRRRRRLGRLRDRLARAQPSRSTNTTKGGNHVPNSDRPLTV